MKYEINNHFIIFGIESPKAKNGWRYSKLDIPITLSSENLILLADTSIELSIGKAAASQSQIVNTILSPILKFISSKRTDLPQIMNDSDWTLFLVNIFTFYLTDRYWSEGSVSTRIRGWPYVANFFSVLKDRKVIPLHVSIPKSYDKKQKVGFEGKKQYVVGENASIKPKITEFESILKKENSVNKLVLDLSYAKDNDKFLGDIELDLRLRIDGIENICSSHWKSMKGVHEKGQQLIAKIGTDRVRAALGKSKYYLRNDAYINIYRTSSSNRGGPAWWLSFLNNVLINTENLDSISHANMKKHPYFPGNNRINEIGNELAMQGNQPDFHYSINTFHRYLGLLHLCDCAVACVLLIIEHPELNPESLQESKLLSVNGNHYLIATDGRGKMIFSVDKPRARTRKRILLSNRAKEIIEYIIKCTSPIRRIMKLRGDPNWRYLFLTSSSGILKATRKSGICSVMNTQLWLSLHSMHKSSFEEIGVSHDSFTFSRIRNTLGILEWFRTGQLRDMSKKLGNTERVCLEHYIPPWLLRKWNERLIRRFQQKIILISASNEPYFFEVSDFSSLNELVAFVTQIVISNKKKNDPISDIVHDRLSTHFSENDQRPNADAELGINLSPNSLCALYAFSDWAKRTLRGSELAMEDDQTGFSPTSLIYLSTLLRHVVEAQSGNCNTVDSAIKSKLQGDSAKSLQNAHEQALRLLPDYEARFSTFSVFNLQVKP